MMALNAFSEVTLSRSKRATRASGKIRGNLLLDLLGPEAHRKHIGDLARGHFAGTSSVWPQ